MCSTRLTFLSVLCWVYLSSAYNLRNNLNNYVKNAISRTGPLPLSQEVKIIGGQDAAIEDYPFAVSLQYNGTFFGHDVEHFCGGSIINKSWIITTALCGMRMWRQTFHVRAGSKDYYKGGTIYEVESVVIHPLFNYVTYDYDVGLVKLTENIIFDDTKQPIKLPKENEAIPDRSVLKIIGWGAQDLLQPISDKLQRSAIPKISDAECRTVYDGASLTNRMFCAFSSGIGPCIGDSGSPAVLHDVLVGMASWSQSCAYVYPTVYAKVSEAIDWVHKVTRVN